MADFFHGSGASFDEFDNDRIRVRPGDSSQIQFGRGLYAAEDMATAGRWIDGSPQHGGVIYRFTVDDNVLNDPRRFISQDDKFGAHNIDYMAARAEEMGHTKAAESFRNLSKNAGDKPIKGSDIADLTKYEPDVGHYLRSNGFLGFRFDVEKSDGSKIKNAVFINAGDIPATTPIVTQGYVNSVIKQGQQVDPGKVPPALSQKTEAFLQQMEMEAKELGISPAEIDGIKGRVTALSQAAADVTDYKSKSQMSPLKLTDAALATANGMDRRLADAMRAETAAFVSDSMKSVGQKPRPAVLTDRLADTNRYDLGYIHKGEYGYKPTAAEVAAEQVKATEKAAIDRAYEQRIASERAATAQAAPAAPKPDVKPQPLDLDLSDAPRKPGAAFEGIMKGDEVKRYMQQFVLPDNIRIEAQARNPNVKLPENADDVLKDVKGIWEKKGFLSPAELRAELLQKYLPDSDPKVTKFITDMELSRNKPEIVTGYLSKEHAYDATGLAHLYAKETGKPIVMAEVDFSNMGGTNEEYKRRIAAERNIHPDLVNGKEAEQMTDKAVKLLSDSLTTELGDRLPPGAKIVPIRTGGDELRIIFTGVDDPAQLKQLTAQMHAAVERHVAGLGLQDHPHLKDPKNPVRNGFGAALTMQDMGKIENPANLIQHMDEDIKRQKDALGRARLGQIDEVQARKALETELGSGAKKVPEGQTRQGFIETEINRMKAQAVADAKVLSDRNPIRSPANVPGGLAASQVYIDANSARMAATPIVHANAPAALDNAHIGAAQRPAGLQPMAGMDERRSAIAQSHLSEGGKPLTAAERHFVVQSTAAMTPNDPSSRTLQMGEDFNKTVDAYAAEAKEFRQKISPTHPAIEEALHKSGLSSLDDVKPHVMAVSFHNLAGLNNSLGHNNADVVLREFGAGIIEESMAKAGFDVKSGPKPYTIAHHGGGNFSVLTKPGCVGVDGKPVFMSPDMLKGIEKDIAARVTELNNKPIAQFLEDRGVKVDAELRAELESNKLSTFADIEDPKSRGLSTNDKLTGRVNGIHSAVSSGAVDGDKPGSAVVSAIRKEADVKMTGLRDAEIMRQVNLRPPSPISGLYDTIKDGPIAMANHPNGKSMYAAIQGMGFELEATPGKPYMQFGPKNMVPEDGWKFHLTFESKDTGRAAEIVMEEMQKHGHQAPVKIATEGQNKKYSDPNYERAGRNITIYSDGNPERMKGMMQDIENRLKAEGIKPGPAAKGDRAVPGSDFASYRNDQKGGRYSADISNYNPGGHSDPYKDMAIGKPGPVAAAPDKPQVADVDQRKTFLSVEVDPVTTRDGLKTSYIDLKGREPQHIQNIEAALRREGIEFTQKPSSFRGGTTVIAIDPKSMDRFEAKVAGGRFMAEAPEHQSATSPRPESARPAAPVAEPPRVQAAEPPRVSPQVTPQVAAAPAAHATPAAAFPQKPMAAEKLTQADMDVLRKAGDWFGGFSDQIGGGFKPAIMISIEGKSPAEVAQIEAVMRKMVGPENGSRVVNGLNERGLGHPTSATRTTLSIEGGVGLGGLDDVSKIQGILKESGAGHFEFDDDIRDWKNSTQNKTLSEVQAKPVVPEKAPVATAASPAAPPPQAQKVDIDVSKPAPVAAAPAAPIAAAPVRPEQAHLDEASKRAQEQLAAMDHPAPPSQAVDIDISKPAAPAAGTPAPATLTVDPKTIDPPKTGGFMDGLKNVGKNSGLIGGAVLGVVVGGATLFTSGDAKAAATATWDTAVPYGEAARLGADGDVKGAAKAATVETASNIGGWAGAAAGAASFGAAGALIGSAVPIVGNIVGGVVGGAVGAIVGGIGGGYAVGQVTEYVIDNGERLANKARELGTEAIKTTMTKVGSIASTVEQAGTKLKNNVMEVVKDPGKAATAAVNSVVADVSAKATSLKNTFNEVAKDPEKAARKVLDNTVEAAVAAKKEVSAAVDTVTNRAKSAWDSVKSVFSSESKPAAPASPTAIAKAPAPVAATPATPPAASAAFAPAATGGAGNNYAGMTKTALAAAIQKDPTLLDTVKLNGKEVPLSQALENKTFRQEFLKNLEKAQAGGSDLKEQIAMVKAYEKKIEAAPAAPAGTAPAATVTAQVPATDQRKATGTSMAPA